MWSKGLEGRNVPSSLLVEFEQLSNSTFEALDILCSILYAQATISVVPTVASSNDSGKPGKHVLQREVWQFVRRQHSIVQNFGTTSSFALDLGIFVGWLLEPGHIFRETNWRIASYASWQILTADGWKSSVDKESNWAEVLKSIEVGAGCGMHFERIIASHWQRTDFKAPGVFDRIYHGLSAWNGFPLLLKEINELVDESPK